MKKQNIGLAVSMLGIIFALGRDLAVYMVGVILGIAGLALVAYYAREDEQ